MYLVVLISFLIICGTITVAANSDATKIRGALNRNVYSRPLHRASVDMMGKPLRFHTSADILAVAEVLKSEITPLRREPDFTKPYLLKYGTSDDNSSFILIFHISGKLITNKMTEMVMTLRSDESGTVGSVDITAWTIVDGVMDITEYVMLKNIRNKIRYTISRLDADAQFGTGGERPISGEGLCVPAVEFDVVQD